MLTHVFLKGGLGISKLTELHTISSESSTHINSYNIIYTCTYYVMFPISNFLRCWLSSEVEVPFSPVVWFWALNVHTLEQVQIFCSMHAHVQAFINKRTHKMDI